MKKYNLEFCFKGTRTYVHGTDIYNVFVEEFKDEMKKDFLDISFHGIARSNILLVEEKPEDDKIKFASKYIDLNDEKKVFYGIENGVKINCRYEYREEDICKLSELDIKSEEVALNSTSSFSFIENVVALNKYLLESLFPDVEGKWYFTRLQLKQVLMNGKYPLNLKLKANFNLKLTKTEIFIDNTSVGFIYFSLV